ncbi:methyltransferase domain-containing protein [Candidatus Parcubacteria bacterium]|nr:methyltransferase domain-containing protein [Candidatus Parcubacteria bacterium]
MSQKEFENERWSGGSQNMQFRHSATLEMIKDGKVLDLGCGDGYLLSKLKKKGIEGYGIDFSDKAVEKCRKKNLNVVLGDLREGVDKFQIDKFEYVTILDNLEHLFFPEKVLKDASKVSQNVIISVPNFNSLPARLQVLKGYVPENNRPNKGHVYWFNYVNLMKMFENCNLEIVELKMNTFWENKIMIGKFLKMLTKYFPGLFALSFVVLLKEK